MLLTRCKSRVPADASVVVAVFSPGTQVISASVLTCTTSTFLGGKVRARSVFESCEISQQTNEHNERNTQQTNATQRNEERRSEDGGVVCWMDACMDGRAHTQKMAKEPLHQDKRASTTTMDVMCCIVFPCCVANEPMTIVRAAKKPESPPPEQLVVCRIFLELVQFERSELDFQ